MQELSSSLVWAPVPGYEGIYEVSNEGDVRRLAGYRCKKARVLSRCLDAYGYPVVVLRKNGESKMFKNHRLVAMAFIPGDWSLDVNHKDSVRDNCCVENLEWVDHPSNMRHGKVKGRMSKKLTSEERLAIQSRHANGEGYGRIASDLGLAKSTVAWIVKYWSPDSNLPK